MRRWHSILASAGLALSLGCLLSLPACELAPDTADEFGQVGVFYGGQVQELEIVPIGAGQKPTLGFRLQLQPGEGPRRISWEVLRAGPSGRRVTEHGEASAPGERKSFDKTFDDLSSARGVVNIRVLVDNRVVIDRALVLRSVR